MAIAGCVSVLCVILSFFAVSIWGKKKHSTAVNIWPNANQLWEERKIDLRKIELTSNQTHRFSPWDESEFKRGVQDIASKMIAGDPVVLCVGGGDVLTAEIAASAQGLDPEFGLPKQFCTGNELSGNESWSGERYALRWYANQGYFPANSVKFHR